MASASVGSVRTRSWLSGDTYGMQTSNSGMNQKTTRLLDNYSGYTGVVTKQSLGPRKEETMAVTITITEEQLKDFREAHKKALRRKQDVFEFEGLAFNTSYAGYLIEYLITRFAETK